MTGAEQEQGVAAAINQQTLILRALHGDPLTVLVALHLFGPMSRRAVGRRTGCKRRAVEEALCVLEEVGLVERAHYREWRLASGAETTSSLAVGELMDVMEGGPPDSGADAIASGVHAETLLPGGDDAAGANAAADAEETAAPEVAREDSSAEELEAGRGAEVAWDDTSAEATTGESAAEVAWDDTSAPDHDHGFSFDHDHDDVFFQKIKNDDQHHDHDQDERSWSEEEVAYGAGEAPFAGAYDDEMRPSAADERTTWARASAEEDKSGAGFGGAGAEEEAAAGEYETTADDETAAAEVEALLVLLQALDPPFDRAEAWLEDVSLPLVSAWLAHLEAMPWSQRELLHNEAAFLRSRVEQGRPPPARRQVRRTRADTEARRPACPRCGKRYRNRRGECLYCAGLIQL